jgi:hypothetical protein
MHAPHGKRHGREAAKHPSCNDADPHQGTATPRSVLKNEGKREREMCGKPLLLRALRYSYEEPREALTQSSNCNPVQTSLPPERP